MSRYAIILLMGVAIGVNLGALGGLALAPTVAPPELPAVRATATPVAWPMSVTERLRDIETRADTVGFTDLTFYKVGTFQAQGHTFYVVVASGRLPLPPGFAPNPDRPLIYEASALEVDEAGELVEQW